MTDSSTASRCSRSDDDEDASADYLDEVPDGAGCTGIWEYLSERRKADD